MSDFSGLTSFLDELVTRYEIPGNDCVVFHRDHCVYRHQRGFSDAENRVPMTGAERYNIYSCSKLITCVAALQLFELGRFKLDDELADYLPEFAEMSVADGDQVRPARRRITIRHLFTMTAGFSYDVATSNLQAARREIPQMQTRAVMRYLARDPLLFDPGDRWNYSLCHDALAALVEDLSRQPFEDYVRERITEPLGMCATTFMLPAAEIGTITPQYIYNGQAETRHRLDGHIRNYKLGSAFASGGAGCISTVDDYITFLEALRTGDSILRRETIDLMSTDQLTEAQFATSWSAGGYGYGLGCRCRSARRVDDGPTDFGWGGAAGAYAAVDRAHDFTVFYAQHVLSSPAQPRRIRIAGLVRDALSR
jgi:CubicO group peptidase (beta-lactamase class C family)